MNTGTQIVALINTNGIERTERLSITEDRALNIGRGWQNDLIVNDQYTDAKHLSLSIDESGVLSVRDLETKNGSRINKKIVTTEQVYEQGSIIQVGESQLRFYNAEQTVMPALALDTTHIFSRKYNSLPFVGLLTFIALLALYFYFYFFSGREFSANNAFSTITGFCILGVIWVFIAGFIGKLFRQETNIGMHWMLLCVLTIAMTIFNLPVEIIKFNIDSSLVSTIIDQIFIAVGVSVFVYASLSFATRLSTKKKLVSALLLTLTPQLMIASSPMLKEPRELWSSEADSKRITQMPSLMWRSPTELDTHLKKLDDLFDEVDEQVQVQ